MTTARFTGRRSREGGSASRSPAGRAGAAAAAASRITVDHYTGARNGRCDQGSSTALSFHSSIDVVDPGRAAFFARGSRPPARRSVRGPSGETETGRTPSQALLGHRVEQQSDRRRIVGGRSGHRHDVRDTRLGRRFAPARSRSHAPRRRARPPHDDEGEQPAAEWPVPGPRVEEPEELAARGRAQCTPALRSDPRGHVPPRDEEPSEAGEQRQSTRGALRAATAIPDQAQAGHSGARLSRKARIPSCASGVWLAAAMTSTAYV